MTPLTIDHEYITNKPKFKFMPKDQYNLMQNKKSTIMPESMISKYLNMY